MNNHAIWVKGEISKLEAFASICPLPDDQFMVSAFAMNFPTATPLQAKDLDQLQRPPSGTFTVVRRSLGPLPTTQATSVTQAPECQAAALRLRHEHVVPAAVLRTLDHLQPGVGWSMVALRQQEDVHLPAVNVPGQQEVVTTAVPPTSTEVWLIGCPRPAETPTTPCHPDLRPLRRRLPAPGPSKD